MEEARKDWASAYEKAKRDLEREIRDIDIFDCNVAKFLSEFFKAGHLVLEAGCGTGRFCFWLNKKGVSCVGIDIVPEIVKKAAFYAKEKGLPTQFIIADVCNLPLRDESIDGYISLGVVEHFRSAVEVIKAFKECRRVLKKRGQALITIPNIFVPLRNRLLLYISRGRIGMFHKAYTKKTFYRFGRIIGSGVKVEVFDLWLPIYNILDGVLKMLGINEKTRRQIRFAFTRLPQQPSLLKHFLGYIYIIANKPALYFEQ
jgi:ubiquinone/menaquinone biosynthesis C-methylase UbiE